MGGGGEGGEEAALPYLAYAGMCRSTGYGFQGVFLDWKPFKECEHLRWAVYICNTNNFFS